MSPNEAQLRAALQEGEGDSLDAGALIAHAVGVRQQRRRRVYLAAGTAVAVAAVGVGIAALTNTSGHDNSTAGGSVTAPANGAQAQPPRPAANPSHGAAAGPTATRDFRRMKAAGQGQTAPAGCPQTASRSLLPGGGGSGQFGASQPLFTHKVAKIVVCGYPAKASASARRMVVRGGAATAVASALESAASKYHARPCPATQAALPGTLELLATDANGTRSRPVVITVGCPKIMATNGTAVRYPDSVPHRFLSLLRTAVTASPVR